jgi:nitrate/nitrite transporter NarK
LLTLHGLGGLSGWQWMFLIEGVPATLMGIAVWRYLPDHPGDAPWLTPLERDALIATIAADTGPRSLAHGDLRRAMLSGRVWLLTLFYFLFAFGLYGISFWLPQILKGFGAMSVLAVGFASAIPFAAAGVAMVLVGRSSDRMNERRIHLALCALAGAAGFFAAAYARSPILELACITLAAAATSSCVGPFWAIPAGILTEAAAAGGIALINSVGNLGGFAGPYVAGFIVQRTHNFAAALVTMGIALAVAAAIALAADGKPRDA